MPEENKPATPNISKFDLAYLISGSVLIIIWVLRTFFNIDIPNTYYFLGLGISLSFLALAEYTRYSKTKRQSSLWILLTSILLAVFSFYRAFF